MDTDQSLYIHCAGTHNAGTNELRPTKEITKADNSIAKTIRCPADCVNLARSSTFLSSRMYNLASSCGHKPTRAEIEEVAGELANVSTVLYRLSEAMLGQPDRYTSAFKYDLKRNNTELGLYLDEISECAEELHKKDPLGADHTVPWFFKKGRVTRLIKHLQLLKGQLSIMRLVLNEGSEFLATDEGQREPRPLTEARVTLEAALAKNQNAIKEVLQYEDARSQGSAILPNEIDSSTATEEITSPQEAGRPESPADPFVDEHRPKGYIVVNMRRRFTKRAAVGDRIPILNIGNNPARLKSKWIKQETNDGSTLTALPEADSSIISTPVNSAPEIIRPIPIRPSQDNTTSLDKAVSTKDQDKLKPENKWSRFKEHSSKLNILKAQGSAERQISKGSERRMSSYYEKTDALDNLDSQARAAQLDTPAIELPSSKNKFWREMKAAYASPFKFIAAGLQKHKVERNNRSTKHE